MALSKNQTIAAVAGGVFAVATLALAYFLYDAYSVRATAEEERDEQWAAFDRLTNASVYPSKVSIGDVKKNEQAVADWRETALVLASGGDKKFDATESSALFKQRLQNSVKRMAALPGGVGGKLVAENFYFGFDKYLGENATLPEQNKVVTLATQLDTIELLADICAKAGVVQIRSITRIEQKQDVQQANNSRNRGKPKKAEAEGPKETVLEYATEIDVRPASFVNLLNALTAEQRFIVVKEFEFALSEDKLASKLGGKEEAKSEGRTSRRRRRAQQEDEKQATAGAPADDGLVTDPEADAPITVKMKLAVHDFGRAQ